MDQQNFSYLFFEVAGLFAALSVIYALGAARTLLTRRFAIVMAGLYGMWLSWDMLAISLEVFQFPTRGNLPIRLLGIPLEEHLFFLVHALVTWALLLLAEPTRPSTD